MEQTIRPHSWLKGILAIAIIGFVLNYSGMRGLRVVHAQADEPQISTTGFSWEYQLDFSDSSQAGARQQASSLSPTLNNQGVTSELQSLGGGNYRLAMAGSQGEQQVRQVLYSPLIASFIGGAAEIEINMPVSSLQDITFQLESNLTTGYRWEIAPSESAGFFQAGEPTFLARSNGFGVPSLQTLTLTPGNLGVGKVILVYRRPFEPNETATRHLRITLAAQATSLDLSDPNPGGFDTLAGTRDSTSTSNPIEEIPLNGALPASLDWRSAGIVPAPRDQGACGGCWSFGTVGIMESAIAKAGGPLLDLSEQFLISCNNSGWNCSGGLTAHKYHYDTLGKKQTAIGAVLEADKPYTATNGTCSVAYNHPYTLSGWQFIVPNEWTMPTVDQIKNAIYTYGPVTAGICAGSAFQSYSGGIFSTDETSSCPGTTFRTNHQIILVGWNDAGGYWIMRNSWGPSWGESGYMKIAYNTSRVGEGTSWVTWNGIHRIFLPLVLRDVIVLPPGGGIVNGDFEGGSTVWTEYSYQGYYPIITSAPPITPHSGSYATWLGGADDETSYVEQQVTISSSAPYLVYWHWIASDDTCGYDFGGVLINGTAVDSYNLCSANNTSGWVTHSVNLSAYAGQSVTLQIRAETDSSVNSNLFVDDVSLQATAASAGINAFVRNLDAYAGQSKSGLILPAAKPQATDKDLLLDPR
jgi:C1A family cysteine protease/predicted secreted protein